MSTYKIVMQHKNDSGNYDTLLPKSSCGRFINISTVAGATLSITGPNNYSQTYTLSSSEDTHGFAIVDDGNYTLKVTNGSKSSSKVITVNDDGIFSYILYPFSSILNNNTWEEISQASSLGIASSLWNIGDVKMDTINGTVGILPVNGNYGFFIIDFDHNSEIEGKGISFMGFKTTVNNGVDIALIDSQYFANTKTGFVMNPYLDSSPYNNNSGGWAYSYMRNTIIPQFQQALSYNLRNVLKSSTIYSDNVGGTSNLSSNVTSTIDEIYLPAQFEIYGYNSRVNSAEPNYQTQFIYYKNGGSKLKYKSSNPSSLVGWWLRSIIYVMNGYFSYIPINDGTASSGARMSLGFAPIFRI